jgi:hypothetical protein
VSLFRYNPEIHDNPEFHGRRHGYDPNQPRVPAGHDDGGRWTRGAYGANAGVPRDDADAPLGRLAFVPPPVITAAAQATARVIGLGLGLLAAKSQSNSRDQQAVAELRVYQYGKDPKGNAELKAVTMLSPAEVEKACRAVGDVQKFTDIAAKMANARELKEGKMRNAEYGTAVHTGVKDEVRELILKGQNPYNLSAEVTYLKGEPETYGTKGAPRTDVYERRSASTICLYDIKTGDSTRNIITPERAAEIAKHTFGEGYTRLFIIEIRPTVKRNPPLS